MTNGDYENTTCTHCGFKHDTTEEVRTNCGCCGLCTVCDHLFPMETDCIESLRAEDVFVDGHPLQAVAVHECGEMFDNLNVLLNHHLTCPDVGDLRGHTVSIMTRVEAF